MIHIPKQQTKEQTMYREETALMNDLAERIAKLRGSL
jgi:hypothetical protein